MDWERIDWDALERLRAAFLDGSAGTRDYWQNEGDLASYDQTFAQRIGWKWDYVLGELGRRGWQPPKAALLDWGCGTGVGSRAFLDHFGAASVSALRLWDRSPLAMKFARCRAQEKYPELPVIADPGNGPRGGILLISHVLTELTDSQRDKLIGLAREATAILWVEPGTYSASRKLIEVRESLRDTFQVVAPCPHQAACGLFAPENQAHWCHHFATPPPEAFTDRNWNRFAALAGIDVRSLPLSFVVLDRRGVPALPAGTVRILGRPRVYKAHATLLGCSLAGIHERSLTKRALPGQFRELKKGRNDPLQIWECDAEEIVDVRPYPGGI